MRLVNLLITFDRTWKHTSSPRKWVPAILLLFVLANLSGAAASAAERGYLGFQGKVLKPGELTITWVNPEGPAFAAGLKKDDVITAFDDEAFTFADEFELRDHLAWIQVGAQVRLDVMRDGRALKLSFKAADLPRNVREKMAEQQKMRLGWRVLERLAREGDGKLHLTKGSAGIVQVDAEGLMPLERQELLQFFTKQSVSLPDLMKAGEHLELLVTHEPRQATSLTYESGSPDLLKRLKDLGSSLQAPQP